MIQTILIFLQSLLPKYWLQNEQYNKDWDKKLNILINHHKFTEITRCTAKLGNIIIWIENHPYASFNPYQYDIPKVRPSRMTKIKAFNKLVKDSLQND